MPADVVGIILDKISLEDHLLHLVGGYEPLGARPPRRNSRHESRPGPPLFSCARTPRGYAKAAASCSPPGCLLARQRSARAVLNSDRARVSSLCSAARPLRWA